MEPELEFITEVTKRPVEDGRCPGGGLSKEYERKGGERRLLTDHMIKLWAGIVFTPTSFKLTDEVEGTGDDDTKEGDRSQSPSRRQARHI
jgi:hypothetical protein